MTHFQNKLNLNNFTACLQKDDRFNDLYYLLILNKNNDGIVFGYEGGGIYEYGLVDNGKVVQYKDEEGDELGWDENLDEWASKNGKNIETINEMMEMTDILGKNFDGGGIALSEEYISLFKNSNYVSFGINNPISFGNISFN